MKLCITGALGHIGAQLIRHLSVSGLEEVHLVDNFLTQRYASLFDLPSDVRFYFHEMDILKPEIEQVIKDSDVLVHLAAVTNAEASFHHPEEVERINKYGLEYVAQLCAKYHCSLIFPSTTSVYGVSTGVVDEACSDAALQPQSPYAKSKLAAEKFLQKMGEDGKLNVIILRLGTIFGYSIGMRFHTAVNKFIWQAVTAQEITVWKTALHQKRPYCGLNDAVGTINDIINTQVFDHEVYNIVTANLTVENILDKIKEFIPELKLKFVDSPIMNQLSYEVANTKSLARGFLYKDNVRERILETIKKLQYANGGVKKTNL